MLIDVSCETQLNLKLTIRHSYTKASLLSTLHSLVLLGLQTLLSLIAIIGIRQRLRPFSFDVCFTMPL